jgi:hypothetical protein
VSSYSEPKDRRRALDVYAPVDGEDHPVVVWIHGGGWRRGDKAAVQDKPRAFVAKGFLFISVNYRLVPDVTVREMAGDIGRAVRWVHDHAAEYGGDPKAIFALALGDMGHRRDLPLSLLVFPEGGGIPKAAAYSCARSGPWSSALRGTS